MLHLLALALVSTATAAPTTVTHQGRVLDISGTPVNGANTATFRLYPSQSALVGTEVWTESVSVQLTNGHYSAVLGNVTPLDTALLESNLELWLEVDINGTSIERQRLHSVPYAISAEGAQTLTRSDCGAGQILQFSGSEWVCASVSSGGGGGVQSFYNTSTAWPGACGTAEQKWTRIGDVVIFSVKCLNTIMSQTSGGGGITVTHASVGTPAWAIPSASMKGSFVGATDSAPLAGASGTADGPLNRAQVLTAGTSAYSVGGYGSFSGQSWTTWLSNFTVIYHVTMQSSGALGTPANPAQSCQGIKDDQPGANDGVYWLDPAEDGNPFEAYCLMSYDAGGWTLISQAVPVSGSARSLCSTIAVGALDLNASSAEGGPAKLSNATINAIWSDGTTKQYLTFSDEENNTGTNVTWDRQCSLDFVTGYQFHTGTSHTLSSLESTTVTCQTGSMGNITAAASGGYCGVGFSSEDPSQYQLYSVPPSYTGGSCAGAESGRSWAGNTGNFGCNTSKVFIR